MIAVWDQSIGPIYPKTVVGRIEGSPGEDFF
jgi:hypothetical protein